MDSSENESIHLATQMLSPGIDSIQLMAQVASTFFDSNQLIIEWKTVPFKSTHDSTLSRTQVWKRHRFTYLWCSSRQRRCFLPLGTGLILRAKVIFWAF